MNLNDIDALLESAVLPETTVPLCLRGDLQSEWEQVKAELAKRKESNSQTLAGGGELAARLEQLEAEMAEATLHVQLRGLPRKDFQSLMAKHPPRKDNQTDRLIGMDQSTFFDALIAECLVSPELDEGRLTTLLDRLTDAQFQRLADAAWGLNRRESEAPFARSTSRTAESSGEKSKPPPALASPTSGSAGGSRKKSSSTTAKKDG